MVEIFLKKNKKTRVLLNLDKWTKTAKASRPFWVDTIVTCYRPSIFLAGEHE